MTKKQVEERRLAAIDDAVSHFVEKRSLFEGFAQALMAYFRSDPELNRHVHFLKHRIKDPDHLRTKLIERPPAGGPVRRANLFDKVTDLAGIRIIHLHTTQVQHIHPAIMGILEEQKLTLLEPPQANCWDVEYEELFRRFGIASRTRESMYTTIHYVIRANQMTKVTCEVQVRTLMDELWGEVSHRVDYPKESTKRACKNQLRVLARLTTGCSRLVDSIFEAHEES